MCGIFLCTCGSFANGGFADLAHRGPDNMQIMNVDNVHMEFYHLSIMCSETELAMQPIHKNGVYLLANAEIYNYAEIAKRHNFTLSTKSDCEVILDLYNLGAEYLNELLGEFAFVMYDTNKNVLVAGRDRYGVRPLFTVNSLCYSSEAKGFGDNDLVLPFTPGNIVITELCDTYCTFTKVIELNSKSIDCKSIDLQSNNIKDLLTQAVVDRLMGDAVKGCFLSGGLDSSIITAIASKYIPNLRTYTIGMAGSSDIKAAKFLTKWLGIDQYHTVIEYTAETGLAALEEVIAALETYDVTTVRASTPQYLLSKYIAKEGKVKVLLSGEGSDELFAGYQYFKNAPSAAALAEESKRLLSELYLFDNLRTDRTTGAWGLEVRVPFLDTRLVDFVEQSDPELRKTSIEKEWLREAFTGLLPDEILWRTKEAFSDAVGSSWKAVIAEYADKQCSDKGVFPSKEAAFYKSIYNKYYSSDLLPHYWMPKWIKQENWDPSATTIDCYTACSFT